MHSRRESHHSLSQSHRHPSQDPTEEYPAEPDNQTIKQ
jgi:hypothetical protein